ncbi:MAG: NrsF family protein [Hyphomicrobiales bacterium]|nr:NrsF family protein [Hyphomicrobiales bacterium]
MKTDDLIAALSADAATLEPPLDRAALRFLAFGALVAALLFVTLLGPRHDWRLAIETVHYPLKFVPTALLAVGGVGALLRLARPDGRIGLWGAVLALAVAVLLAAVAVELAMVPSSDWLRLAIGHNAPHCLALIPFLSIAPLAAAVLAARHGASTRPRLTGLVAGLAAAGIGATLYAMNCDDDSPLFVVLWYPLGIAVVAGLGAWAGRRFLVW